MIYPNAVHCIKLFLMGNLITYSVGTNTEIFDDDLSMAVFCLNMKCCLEYEFFGYSQCSNI